MEVNLQDFFILIIRVLIILSNSFALNVFSNKEGRDVAIVLN